MSRPYRPVAPRPVRPPRTPLRRSGSDPTPRIYPRYRARSRSSAHAGVVLVGIGVDRLDLLGRAGERRFDIAVGIADERLVCLEPGLEPFGNRGARDFGILAFVPGDRQRIERGLGVPPSVRHHRDAGIADLYHLLDARHLLDGGGVEALHLAALHRTLLDRGVEHAGQLKVSTIDLLAGNLVRRVEALDRFAGNLPVLWILELDVLRRFKLRGRLRDLPVSCRPA